ncbi:hypothetical protein RI844_03570 [Thalassotalea fonticola]|uniref:NlpE C-terminal OB domain-containing protein n=1 Tax=Thalassotalea fonticola TaxID=3065649 RepID=A0ABZ0GRA1_9GAMM|nr:hypothetical protein RI844_03570 [Colwelliaceae bacterium S1-1]
MIKFIPFFYLTIVFTNNALANTEQVYKGIYTWGPEVHSFKPCDSTTDYWVSFDWAGIEMQRYYKANKTNPYQAMYIEFRGQILNEKVDGFANDYAGLIRISEVNRYSFELPSKCTITK